MNFLEAHVQRQVTMLLTGEMKYTSFLDRIGHLSNVYEIRGSTYELTDSCIKSHDFTEYVNIVRDANNRVVYNPFAKDLLDLFTPTNQTSTKPPSVAPPRKLFHLLFHNKLNLLAPSLGNQGPLPISPDVLNARNQLHFSICKLKLYVILLQIFS